MFAGLPKGIRTTGANFKQAGYEIGAVLDRDYFDIYRIIDGVSTVIASNVPCNADLKTIDVPEPTAEVAASVVTSIDVYTHPFVNVRNTDYLYVKKMDYMSQRLIAWYAGFCGLPFAYQSRQKINMIMQTMGGAIDLPIPPPLPNQVQIMFTYIDNETGQPFQAEIVQFGKIGVPFTFNVEEITGRIFEFFILHSETHQVKEFTFTPNERLYVIPLHYSVATTAGAVKFLVNSWFTRNNNTMANGLHLDMNRAISDFSEQGTDITFTLTPASYSHHETGQMLTLGVNPSNTVRNIFVTYPDMAWYRVTSATATAGTSTVTATPHQPTAQEQAAYVRWQNW